MRRFPPELRTLPGLLLLLLLVWAAPVLGGASAPGEAKTVNLYFFWGKGCPHCLREKEFQAKLE